MLNQNTVYLGDCLELMSEIPDKSIDLILCDLPYGSISCHWDIVIPFDKLWGQYLRIGKENCCYILFGVQPFTTHLILSNIDMFKYSLVWNKNVPTGMAQAKCDYSPV
jgi:site-specific DNA-methyltransferase (adenine-specific)